MRASGGVIPELYVLRGLLEAVSVQCDRIIDAVESVTGPPAPVDEGACPHPPGRQIDATVLGGDPQILCLVCGQQRAGELET
jgi:hypothetical protein